MPAGVVRVWVDDVAYESPYTDKASREKAITKIIVNNASIGSQINIDIIPSLHRQEHYVTEEAKRGSYSWEIWKKNCQTHQNRTRGRKTFYRPGSKTKKGVCFKCIGIAVYIFSDSSTDHFISN